MTEQKKKRRRSIITCKWCKGKEHRDNLVEVKVGKQIKEFHKHCYAEFKRDKAFKERETELFDKLCNLIMDIHSITVIPKSFFPVLQDLRNGTIRSGGRMIKKYKNGAPYPVIIETYRLFAKRIRWAKQNKDFNSTMNELLYGIAVVSNNLQKGSNSLKRKRNARAKKKQLEEQSQIHNSEYSYKPQESKNDISDILD